MNSQKQEFLHFALQPERNLSELCRRFGISRKSAYALLKRFHDEGEAALEPRSKAPQRSPNKTPPGIEAVLLRARQEYPFWGPRKIRRVLLNEGHRALPAVSTIADIFTRHGLPKLTGPAPSKPWQRFERSHPNELWQMDFKGHLPIASRRSHPLTIIDDHSRYCVCLQDCADETARTVENHLTGSFQRYGLPDTILCDNGSGWKPGTGAGAHNQLSVWLLRLGVRMSHGRPYHPQTQGKNERFNKTLKFELLNDPMLATAHDLHERFEQWRQRYNHIRPHDAIGEQPPIQRYRPSPRTLPSRLPPLQYFESDCIRKVKSKGEITFKNQFYYIGSAFKGLPVALRNTPVDGLLEVFFATSSLGQIDLRAPKSNKHRYLPLIQKD